MRQYINETIHINKRIYKTWLYIYVNIYKNIYLYIYIYKYIYIYIHAYVYIHIIYINKKNFYA